MAVRMAERETSRHTRRPNGPAFRDTIQHRIAARNGAAESIQSPHTEAVSVPYLVRSTERCTTIRTDAIAIATLRSFVILKCLRLNAGYQQLLGPILLNAV